MALNINKEYYTRIFPENIPEELKSIDHWVNWRIIEIKGKITKPPIKPDGKFASVDDKGTWSDFDTVLDSARKNHFGIGFVLTNDYIGLDLDHVIDNKNIMEWAQNILKWDTYFEKSPSGTGIRGIIKGDIPKWFVNRKFEGESRFEMWKNQRYVTITGDVIKNNRINFIDLEESLKNIKYKYI